MEYSFKTIDEINPITQEFVADYSKLITQLRGIETIITIAEVQEIQRRVDSELLVCAFSESNRVIGIVQGTYICTPPMYMVYVNAVVVDESTRGGGLGSRLMVELEERIKRKWSLTVKIQLTSRPNRGTRTFYERLGYIARVPENQNETTVFVKKLIDGTH